MLLVDQYCYWLSNILTQTLSLTNIYYFMRTQTFKREVVNLSFLTKFLLVLTLAFATSCETEEFISEEDSSDIKEEINQQKVTPVVGRTYFIKNRRSGRYIDVAGFSNSNGATLHQWDRTGNANQQWEVISTGGNTCLLYTSPSPRDKRQSRMPSSA